MLFVACTNGGNANDESADSCMESMEIKCDDPNGDTEEATGDSGTSETGGETEGETEGLPSDEIDAMCRARRDDAFNPNRLAFLYDTLRWSCADVDGTRPDERGQEYCEYFAIVRLPDSEATRPSEPLVLGMNLGPDFVDGQTPFGITLTEDEIAALEADPQATVGTCVFTSWNADIEPPACTEEECAEPGEILGVPLTEDVFRMKFDPNSNEAAVSLIEDCSTVPAPEGVLLDPDDPFHDPFFRSCWLNADLNETQHRKSDNVICTAAVRLGECGCRLAKDTELGPGLAPADVPGFALGTWDNPRGLPSGCQYDDATEEGRNIVRCDLSATEVVQNASELKAYCQQRYADDVVVHIEIPADNVTCEPPIGEFYGFTCNDTPWVLAP
jgi:hypothetical protein